METTKKTIIAVVVVTLLLVLLLGLGFGMVAGMNINTNKDKSAEDDSTEDETEETPNASMTIHGIMSSGEAMASSSNEDGSQTLTAIVDKDAGADGTLVWDIHFNDASSEWANGKKVSDYVTITVSEDTQSAILNCLQPFGEQIIVSVKSMYYDGAVANATIDYIRRLEGFKILSLNNDSSSNTYKDKIRVFEDSATAQNNSIVYELQYGVGTIHGRERLESIGMDLGAMYYSEAVTETGYTQGVCVFKQESAFSGYAYTPQTINFKIYIRDGFIFGEETEVWGKLIDWFGRRANGNRITGSLKFGWTVSYEGKEIQSKVFKSTGYYLIADSINLIHDVSFENPALAF